MTSLWGLAFVRWWSKIRWLFFRPYQDERLYALSNIDPFAQASVLSRGLIAEHDNELYIVSPLKKQHFRLTDGYCLEDEHYSITHYGVKSRRQYRQCTFARH